MHTKLVSWIMDHVDDWRDHRDTNYLEDWKEYERLWRGVWESQDKTRESERSRIISPALQQAIEGHAAEIEEAIYGQGGNFFDIEEDMKDGNPQDTEYLKNYMKECFKKSKIRKAIGDSVLLGSIYGTGIAEIVVKKTIDKTPAVQEVGELGTEAIGVMSKTKVTVQLKPVSPQNFLIDPTATSVDEAMGVAIEEYVSAHTVAENVEAGIYKDMETMGADTPEDDLEASWIDEDYDNDRVKILRYYGLVPRKLLEQQEEDIVDLFDEDQTSFINTYGDLVEAIVVIGNDMHLLKAEENPYMMGDRPIIAYQDDTVPNRFWGRGVGEKGYNMQKAIDAQIRSHLDSLALTTSPMIAMDATRMPRGAKFSVVPGKSILTNGNPGEILMPFKFGQTDSANIETAMKFEQMLLQATGTIDTASTQAPSLGGELSMQMSSLIKKNKRTLVNFQDQFLIPFVEKAAWRFMQFDPDNFPTADWKFIPSSTLGMLAREVEQQQLINLMKTLGNSPITQVLMQAVIANSGLSNKQAIIAQLAQASQPDPKQAQMQEMMAQLQAAIAQGTANELNARAGKQQAEAQQTATETMLLPELTKAKLVTALSTNIKTGEGDDKEFERRVKVADLLLKERNLDIKEQDVVSNRQIVDKQMK